MGRILFEPFSAHSTSTVCYSNNNIFWFTRSAVLILVGVFRGVRDVSMDYLPTQFQPTVDELCSSKVRVLVLKLQGNSVLVCLLTSIDTTKLDTQKCQNLQNYSPFMCLWCFKSLCPSTLRFRSYDCAR